MKNGWKDFVVNIDILIMCYNVGVVMEMRNCEELL
jgi:hypothetical protein